MAKLFCVKNPKTKNCLLDFPFVEVQSSFINEKGDFPTIGYLVQCTEYSHNRYGGTNGWEIAYFLPVKEGYEFLPKDDRLLNLYNPAEDIKKAKTIFSGKRDGIEDEFILVKDKTSIEDFILRPVNVNWHRNIKEILPLLKNIHYWNGKPSQMALRGDYLVDRSSRRVEFVSDESQSRFIIFSHENEENNIYDLWEEGEFQGNVSLSKDLYDFEVLKKMKEVKPEDCENRSFVDEDERPRRLRRRRPRPEEEAPTE